MTDPIPNYQNRLAYGVSLIFHPSVVMIPTLLWILRDVSLPTSLSWTGLIAAIILIPGFSLIAFLKLRDRHTYQRSSRPPLYVLGWLSVLACLAIIITADGPRVLAACMASLLIWLPLQLTINHFVTKVSVHAAVIAGCVTALIFLERINTPVLVGIAIAIVIFTGWARIETKHHTVLQVVLGVAVGAGTVGLMFPLLLS